MSQENNSTIYLRGVELHWVKCDPTKPANAMTPGKPKQWEVQVRFPIDDKLNHAVVKGAGLTSKIIMPDEDGAKPYHRMNLHKAISNREGKSLAPVKVVDGAMNPIDPNTVGNGSIGNVRLHVYPYELRDPETRKVTKSGFTAMLMGIQLTELRVYKKKPMDDFSPTDTKIINPEANGEEPGLNPEDNPEAGADNEGQVF